MRARRQLAWLLALAAGALLVAAVYLFALNRGRADVLAQGAGQLQLMAPELESALEKFETLPFVLGFQGDVADVLLHPDDRQRAERLNRILQTIQVRSKVGAIYLMDRSANTLAASNWDQPLSFVGKNFGFRPYVQEALAGRAGRFYGIGSTTSEPGYFISQPVWAGGAVAGVMAVKISLAEFERNWRGSDDTIVLADSAGVVFLANRPGWKYRSLRPLAPQVQQQLASTLQYGRQPIAPIGSAAGASVARPVGRLGWQLMLFPSPQRVANSAALWAAGGALLLASAAAGWRNGAPPPSRCSAPRRNSTSAWPNAPPSYARPTRTWKRATPP